MEIHKIFPIYTIFVLCPLLIPGNTLPEFSIPCYLQAVTESSAIVCFELKQSLSTRFIYGKSLQDMDTLNLPAKEKQAVTLNRLPSGTRYFYNLLAGTKRLLVPDSQYFFYTFPGMQRRPFTFAGLGDTRSGMESFDLDHQSVVKSIIQHTLPDFMIHTGDIAGSNDPARWQKFFSIQHPLLRACPVFAVRGNSEQDTVLFYERFRPLGGNLWTAFSYGLVSFIGLDILHSPADKDYKATIGKTSLQYSWLDSALTAVSNQQPDFIVVFFHEPLFPVDGRGSQYLRSILCPLFEKHHVDLVINGNQHYFAITQRKGIPYIISGGGGAALTRTKLKKGEASAYHPLFHHLRVKVNFPAMDIMAIDNQGNIFFTHAVISRKVQPAAESFVEQDLQDLGAVIHGILYGTPDCSDCEEFKEQILPQVRERLQPGSLHLEFINMDEPARFEQYTALESRLGYKKHTFPVLMIGRRLLSGKNLKPDTILAAIDQLKKSLQSGKRGKGMNSRIFVILGVMLLMGAIIYGLFKKRGRHG